MPVFDINSLTALMLYFNVDMKEFRRFWLSLSSEEREYYKYATIDD